MLELVERHKLHDVRLHILAAAIWVERSAIAIKSLHRAEIGRSNADYDDWQGQGGAANDLLNRRLHIADHPVGQD